ncbi:MAG: S41 family peptidase [Bacteroidota bacterium]
MKLVILLLFLSASLAYGQKFRNGDIPAFFQTMDKDSTLREFELLYNMIKGLHPGLTMHSTQAELDRCYDSLRKTITTPQSIGSYYIKTSCLIAKVHDHHTQVDPALVKSQLEYEPVFPFHIYRLNGAFIIRKSASPDYDSLAGKTLLSVNGQSMPQIIARIRPLIGLEGQNESGLNYSLQNFPFYYYFFDPAGHFDITWSDANGEIHKNTIPGVEFADYRRSTRRVVPPVEQQFYGDSLGVLTVNTFLTEDLRYYNTNYQSYFDDFFNKLHKQKIRRLIIDVRGNGGGDPEMANYLFSWLTDKEYRYFDYVGTKYLAAEPWRKYCTRPDYLHDADTLHATLLNGLYSQIKDYWWFEPQKGKKHAYDGQLIVLADGGSFSTTGHFLTLLREYGIGQLYGECSEGSSYSNDGGLQFFLPYSHFVFRIPTAQFRMHTEKFQYDPKGICPDVEILPRAEDFKTGYDRQLLTTVRMINTER